MGARRFGEGSKVSRRRFEGKKSAFVASLHTLLRVSAGTNITVSDRAKMGRHDVGRKKFGRNRPFGCLMPITYDVIHIILFA